ncbi:cobyrinic acid a,c-diamide synthase [Natronomonas gomsonensis]|uniref:cobyrinic acid a,c-diamide synthase n=1 Tax=Natronomonas gomsonensis TaxID=1046043 RepID=UPI0015C00505
MNGVVLAGTSSGVGKTVATLAVLRALQRAGESPQPAKAGPDFIDPSHHAAVCERPSRTLDPWLSGEEGCRRNYHRGSGDICVVEGMMGLYDGTNSTAYVAETLDLPVVLVVDAKAGMESVAAQALGFREYAAEADRDIDVVGVLANRAHGGRHEAGIRDALPDSLSYFGRVPPLEGLEIPDRHLGLHMGREAPIDEETLDEASEEIHVGRLLEVAAEPARPEPRPPGTDTEKTVAVADDAAFCFRYPASLERLRERAEVVTFSPVAGDSLPDCDGVYLPGGYPELHGAALAAGGTLSELGGRATEGLPVLGECGGLMALSETLTDTDGDTHAMAGVLPADVTMCERYQALDHVELVARDDTLTAGSGQRLRGHEFHYSTADVAGDADFAFEVKRGDGIADGKDGLTEYRTLGTYAHVHADSGAFDSFVDSL